MSRHLKRINAPKSWRIRRRTTKYIVKPMPGAHMIMESLPLSLVLIGLGHAATAAEAKKILNTHQVFVDGKLVRSLKAQLGLLDSLALPNTNEYYRVVFDKKGRLHIVPIPKAEAGVKLCKVEGKTVVSGGRIQFNLNDGRNICADNDTAKVGDSLLIQVPGQKIQQRLTLEKGALIYLIGGKHIGTFGVLENVRDDEIVFTINGKSIATAKKYALVVGKDKPAITLSKEE